MDNGEDWTSNNVYIAIIANELAQNFNLNIFLYLNH